MKSLKVNSEILKSIFNTEGQCKEAYTGVMWILLKALKLDEFCTDFFVGAGEEAVANIEP